MSELESVRDFYDHLASEYHLIYPDWRHAVRRQGAVLDRLIRSILGAEARRVLDCACGIGTQAIGLAARGYDVTATDISAASVERARTEAESFGASLRVGIADMRALADEAPGGVVDVVLACDNALPHLVTDEDLGLALRNVAARLRPGGLFVTSTRDYDRAVVARPRATLPETFEGADGKRIVFQAWEWDPDGTAYTVRLFILRESGGEWEMSHHATRYRAIPRNGLTALVRASGLGQIRWHSPAETGFFQPILTARRPE